MIIKNIILVLAGLLLILLACGKDKVVDNDYFDYIQEDPITDVFILDSPVKYGDSVGVVGVYPYGCNELSSVTYERRNDSLIFHLMRRYYYLGQPCAHGTGLDTTFVTIMTDTVGLLHFIYTFVDSMTYDEEHIIADSIGYYDYSDELFLDTVQIDNWAIPKGDSFMVAYSYPGGCNNPDSVYVTQRNDTLDFHASHHFYYDGSPCAHNSGSEMEYISTEDFEVGEYIVHYVRFDGEDVYYNMVIAQPL